MPKVAILGVKFDNLSMNGAVEAALETALCGNGYCVTPNPEIVWRCRRNPALTEAVNSASLVVSDGIGVVYASKILDRPLTERVPGFELASRLAGRFAQNGVKLFLLGAKPGVAEKAAENLKAQNPGLDICGIRDGYFQDDSAIIEAINDSGAQAVFVCLGSPRQELWMAQNLGKTRARFMIGLGGSLDVFAGEVKRAPAVWVRLNLEWLYRALTQPARFIRLLSAPRFLFAVLLQRFREG